MLSNSNQDSIQLSPNDQERLAGLLINPPELSDVMLKAKEARDRLFWQPYPLSNYTPMRPSDLFTSNGIDGD